MILKKLRCFVRNLSKFRVESSNISSTLLGVPCTPFAFATWHGVRKHNPKVNIFCNHHRHNLVPFWGFLAPTLPGTTLGLTKRLSTTPEWFCLFGYMLYTLVVVSFFVVTIGTFSTISNANIPFANPTSMLFWLLLSKKHFTRLR